MMQRRFLSRGSRFCSLDIIPSLVKVNALRVISPHGIPSWMEDDLDPFSEWGLDDDSENSEYLDSILMTTMSPPIK